MRNNKLIQFYLTDKCNSRCKTCQIWKNQKGNKIPFKEVAKIINKFQDADYVFGGGEVTLYEDLGELLVFCDHMNTSYTLLSNAVNYDSLDKYLRFYRVPNLTMSCDGINHDAIRGVKGNLENIGRIVREYCDKVNIKLSYTLSSLNERNMNYDMQLFKALGFNKIYFCIAQDMDLLKVAGKQSIVPKYESLVRMVEEYGDMLYDKDKAYIKSLINCTRKPCDSTSSVHTIYTNGDVVLCQSIMSSYVLGNIYKDNFADILKRHDNNFICPHDYHCDLLCQRRYD
jgi:MoaA/NifB/PqqE/SkfB family radical SAM enzyme